MGDKDSYEVSFFKNAGKKKADTVDPNVINDELIKRYIHEYNAENKIYGMDDMPFYDLLELRLSFQNILKIQNLRGLYSLKKLCLDNNIITKIEGLGEELSNLEWLDLSFNNISVVEGLEELVSLTDLSLFHNLIKEVSDGLDACKKLNVLSLGDNKISDKEPTVSYLRSFPNLQVLKIEGNDIYSDPMCRSYIMAHVSQLKYLDYMLIDPQEVAKARDDHREELQARESLAHSADEMEKELAKQKRQAELAEAFLAKTDDPLKHVMEEYEDEEKKVKILLDQSEHLEKFTTNFGEGVKKFQERIIKMNEIRLQMIAKFNHSIKQAEEENEREDIKQIGEFERDEKKALRMFEGDQDDENDEEILRTILPKIDDLENMLIDKELQLVERVNEAIDRFEKSLKSTVEGIKEESKTFQEEMNKEVELYFTEVERVRDEQMKLFLADNPNLDQFTPEQKELYADRDGLNNAISTLSEEYKNMVFSIEDDITKAYEEELEGFITQFKDDKHERNRVHIREIMDLVREKRNKIENALDN